MFVNRTETTGESLNEKNWTWYRNTEIGRNYLSHLSSVYLEPPHNEHPTTILKIQAVYVSE